MHEPRAEQLDRIEAKLDQLIAAISEDPETEQDAPVEVVTMDGNRHVVPVRQGLGLSQGRGEGQKSGPPHS